MGACVRVVARSVVLVRAGERRVERFVVDFVGEVERAREVSRVGWVVERGNVLCA